MKIAQVAPLIESVPPVLYGGTERVVAYLTDELVQQGHEVTLFASGDSRTRAQLVACCETAARLNPAIQDPMAHQLLMLDRVRRRADDFDVIHFHIDLLPALLFDHDPQGALVTLHGRLDLPDLQPFYRHFDGLPLVSISDSQRAPMPPVRWAGTVHHGLPIDLLQPTLRPRDGGYLAFLGRICSEKRPDRAIEIARRSALPLHIAAKVDKVDRDYFQSRIKPLIQPPEVQFVGEIRDADKSVFLGNALALLFPIDWPEPFGLALIEAMACGTPVIAWNCGSVPEIVEDGVTGFIVDSIEQAVDAVARVPTLDRARVRERFEQRFTAPRMARDYVAIYRELVAQGSRAIPDELRPRRAARAHA